MHAYLLSSLTSVALCSLRTLQLIIPQMHGNSLDGQASTSSVTLFLLLTYGFGFFSLELRAVESKCRDEENRLEDKKEGKDRIIYIKSVLQV